MTLRNFLKRIVLAPFADFKGSRKGNCIALTFDDGPDAKYTPLVSSALRVAGVRATFFLVGERMKQYPQLVAQLLEDGHELASHSMTHADIAELPMSYVSEEIDAPFRLRLPDGNHALTRRLFRPPKGIVSLPLVWHCARNGIRMVFWSKDPTDYQATSPKQITSYFATNPLEPGDIVLLHDKTSATCEAIPSLVEHIVGRGLQPVTISELLK